MRDGVTPSALLFAALGLVLTLAPRNALAPSVATLLTILTCVALIPLRLAWSEGAFLGCWISVIVTAGVVQLFRRIAFPTSILLSINAGAWASTVTALSNSRFQIFASLPWVLILIPAAWVTRRHGTIALKVASSWLIAIAALSATLQWLPVTPGYLPDHLE